MGKIRIYEIAKEMGVDNASIIQKLKEHGIVCESSLSTIEAEDKIIETVKRELTMTMSNKNSNDAEKKSEVSDNKEEGCESSSKTKEELSIFFRKKEENSSELQDSNIGIPNGKSEDPKDDSSVNREEIVSISSGNNGSLVTSTLAVIGFFISVVAIFFTLNLYSKTWLVPQTVKTMIKSQGNSADNYAMLRLKIDQLEAKLAASKKIRLKREIDVIKYLAEQSDGETKAKLKDIGSDLAALLSKL